MTGSSGHAGILVGQNCCWCCFIRFKYDIISVTQLVCWTMSYDAVGVSTKKARTLSHPCS